MLSVECLTGTIELIGEHQVVGILLMGSDRAQHKQATWDHPVLGPSPAGGVVSVWCIVIGWQSKAVKLAETGFRNMFKKGDWRV